MGLEAELLEALKKQPNTQIGFANNGLPQNLAPNQNLTSEQQLEQYKQQYQFAEPGGFIGKITKLRGEVSVIGLILGVVLSSTVGGLVMRFLPGGGLSQYATVIAGLILIAILKNGMARDFAYGVLIAGLANLLQGFTSGLSLPGFSEGYGNMGGMRDEFAETRNTFGGSDGIDVLTPGRATFR